MRIAHGLGGLFTLLLWPIAVPATGLPRLDQQLAGPHTQVVVLGSVHLAGLPKDFDPASLAPLLERLAAYKPTIITVEALSGISCDLMRRQPALFAPADVAHYCPDTTAAKTATGLDVYAATAQVQKTLSTWPAEPSPAQRRHLAALFLASGDPGSALVQWLQLPEAQRHAGDGLDDTLAAVLSELTTKHNEDFQIAAPLAARLGLQRLYPIDDHTGDNVLVADDAAFGKAIQQAWDSSAASLKPEHDQEAALEKRGDMLALYRLVNQPTVLQAAIAGDFGAALRYRSPQHYGQLYVGGWETRNLRMVSNVREAFREHPGARVLSIVGASHKPWFDGLLGQMQGVDVMDVEKLLQAP